MGKLFTRSFYFVGSKGLSAWPNFRLLNIWIDSSGRLVARKVRLLGIFIPNGGDVVELYYMKMRMGN